MKNLLITFAITIFLSYSIVAQPQHIGVLVNTQIEGTGTGNGTIIGGEVQNVHRLGEFELVNNLSVTFDKKGYLNSFGLAPRLHSRVRYHLPISSDINEGHRTFIQTGLNVSGVQYTGSGGYAKYAVQPVLGVGYDFTPVSQAFSLVILYNYDFKSSLHAQKSFTNTSNRVLDGWTWGQQGRAEISIPVKPSSSWLYLINASGGKTTYRRNPAVYGPTLGSELHKFTVWELSIGIGKLY